MTRSADSHQIVDRSAWLAAHQDHLVKEKAFTRQHESLVASRRELPWLEVPADYVFDTEDGETDLLGLFGGKSQLLVYHFMFGPDWGDEGCPSCSFWADSYNGVDAHLAARDTAFAVVSRASMSQIQTYKKRMGWNFRWVSSGRSEFNFDLGVSARPEQLESGEKVYNLGTATPMGPESPGTSSFFRDGDRVYVTFQVFARGLEGVNSAYQLLDLTAKGRDEDQLPWTMAWLHRHDSYPSEPVS